MLLFGGCSSGFGPCPQGDLWAFDPAARAGPSSTPADGPAARSNPALVFDPRGQRALLIGGLTDAGYAADLWSRHPTTRRLRPGTPGNSTVTSPPARASHDAVMTRGDLYLFGGTGDAGIFDDLWRLSFAEDE